MRDAVRSASPTRDAAVGWLEPPVTVAAVAVEIERLAAMLPGDGDLYTSVSHWRSGLVRVSVSR